MTNEPGTAVFPCPIPVSQQQLWYGTHPFDRSCVFRTHRPSACIMSHPSCGSTKDPVTVVGAHGEVKRSASRVTFGLAPSTNTQRSDSLDGLDQIGISQSRHRVHRSKLSPVGGADLASGVVEVAPGRGLDEPSVCLSVHVSPRAGDPASGLRLRGIPRRQSPASVLQNIFPLFPRARDGGMSTASALAAQHDLHPFWPTWALSRLHG